MNVTQHWQTSSLENFGGCMALLTSFILFSVCLRTNGMFEPAAEARDHHNSQLNVRSTFIHIEGTFHSKDYYYRKREVIKAQQRGRERLLLSEKKHSNC